MSVSILRTSAALVVLIAFATFAAGQNRERFGISAKAGGINALGEDAGGNLWLGSGAGAVRLARSGFLTYDEGDGIN
ncbi:MAG: hypothetical protein ABR607_07570, partial [Pyrinomonadaceae bacterium]